MSESELDHYKKRYSQLSAELMVSNKKLKQKEAEVDDFKELSSLATAYINEVPCDPDIYPEQLEAWVKYTNKLKESAQ